MQEKSGVSKSNEKTFDELKEAINSLLSAVAECVEKTFKDQKETIIEKTDYATTKVIFTNIWKKGPTLDEDSIKIIIDFLEHPPKNEPEPQSDTILTTKRSPKKKNDAESLFHQLTGLTTLPIKANKELAFAVFNLLLLAIAPQYSPYFKPYEFHDARQKETIQKINEKKPSDADSRQEEIKKFEKARKNEIEAIKKIVTGRLMGFNPNELKTVRSTNNRLQKRLKELEINCENQQAELEALRKSTKVSENEETKQQLQDSQKKLMAQNTIIEQLQQKLREKENADKDLMSNLTELSSKNNQMKKSLAADQMVIEDLKKNEERYKRRVQELENASHSEVTGNIAIIKKTKKVRHSGELELTIGNICRQIINHIAKKYRIPRPKFDFLSKPKYGLQETLTLNGNNSNNLLELSTDAIPVLENLIELLQNYPNSENINTTSSKGWTLIRIATYFIDQNTVKLLIDNHAEVSSQHKGQLDPLALAIVHDCPFFDILLEKAFKEHKATSTFINKNLYYAENFTLLGLAIELERTQIVSLLLEKTIAFPNRQVQGSIDKFEYYVQQTVSKGNSNILEILLAYADKCKPHLKLNSFLTSVTDLDCLKVLLYHGASIKANEVPEILKDKDLFISNFHLAAATNDYKLCNKTLELDFASATSRNFNGALNIAVLLGHVQIVDFLLTPRFGVVFQIQAENCIKTILRSKNLIPVLQVFLKSKLIDAFTPTQVSTLISELGLKQNYHEQILPLLAISKLASHVNDKYLLDIKLLLQNPSTSEQDIVAELAKIPKASLRALKIEGRSPLFYAVSQNKKIIAQKLLELGEPVSELAEDCITPLHMAVRNNNPEMVKLLLSFRAEIQICSSSFSQIPLSIALLGGFAEIIQLLTDPTYNTPPEITKSIVFCLDTIIKTQDHNSLSLLLNNSLIFQNRQDKKLDTRRLLNDCFPCQTLQMIIAKNYLSIFTALMKFKPMQIEWSTKNKGLNCRDIAILSGNSEISNTLREMRVMSTKISDQFTNDLYPYEFEEQHTFLTGVMNNNIHQCRRTLQFIDIHKVFPLTGMTYLMLAVLRGNTDVVRFLIEQGAKVDTVSPVFNVTASDLAMISNVAEIKAKLQEKKIISTPNDIPSFIPAPQAMVQMPNFFNLTFPAINNSNNNNNTSNNTSNKRRLSIDLETLCEEFTGNLDPHTSNFTSNSGPYNSNSR